jgi:hypothetical protein
MASSVARKSNIFHPFEVGFKAKKLTAQWRLLGRLQPHWQLLSKALDRSQITEPCVGRPTPNLLPRN